MRAIVVLDDDTRIEVSLEKAKQIGLVQSGEVEPANDEQRQFVQRVKNIEMVVDAPTVLPKVSQEQVQKILNDKTLTGYDKAKKVQELIKKRIALKQAGKIK